MARLAVRPVFTAHPTEAARRTTLSKLRRVAELLDDEPGPRTDRRLAEVVELLWQTDDLRVARPDVIDEARNAVYYLEELARDALPDVLEELATSSRRVGVELPADRPPLRFGTWIGGDRDGNPNVTPAVVAAVLALQHEHALRVVLDAVDGLRQELSSSTRWSGSARSSPSSLAADLAALPEIDPRYLRLNAEEPYRLKATCMQAEAGQHPDPAGGRRRAPAGPRLRRRRRPARRPGAPARLAAGAPRHVRRARDARAGGPGRRGDRAAAGVHGRARARRRAPRGRRRLVDRLGEQGWRYADLPREHRLRCCAASSPAAGRCPARPRR